MWRLAPDCSTSVKNFAVVPTQVTVPETGVAAFCNVKVAVVTVKGAIASLNVAVMLVPVVTPEAPPAGFVEITVGGVVLALDARR